MELRKRIDRNWADYQSFIYFLCTICLLSFFIVYFVKCLLNKQNQIITQKIKSVSNEKVINKKKDSNKEIKQVEMQPIVNEKEDAISSMSETDCPSMNHEIVILDSYMDRSMDSPSEINKFDCAKDESEEDWNLVEKNEFL